MGNSATGGCCCFGCDSTPDVPENIIPDPENGEVCEFTIQRCGWTGFSRDCQAFKGLGEAEEANRWLFLNKSGSTWGGNCKMAVENFIREKPDNPKEGQILWEADFVDSPYFQQYLRVPDSAKFGVMLNELGGALGGFGMGMGFQDDDYYYNHGGGWSRDYVCTLFINWTLNTHAKMRTETRQGYGCDLKLGVFASGTAVARYYEVEEHHEERDDEGNVKRRWTTKRWEKDVREYVDIVQFCLVTGNAGPGFQEGQLLALPDGSPAKWQLPGDASDWTQNYDTPYFAVQQEGGWFSKKDKKIITKPMLDPALCLLIGHLGTSEFSAAGIKEAFHPDFPYDPRGAVMMGCLNPSPPPPPVVVVQQPYQVTYVQTNVQYVTVVQQPIGVAQPGMVQPQMVQPQMQMAPQPQVMHQPGYAQPMAQPMGQPMAQPMPQQGMQYAQPYPQGQPMPQQAMPAQPMAQAQPMPQEAPQPPPEAPAADDPAAKLQKLKGMLDAGLIDQDDYEKKKDAILETM